MPTINYYLEPEQQLGGQDVKKLATAIRGTVVPLKLPAKYLNGTKIKPGFKLQTILEGLVAKAGVSGAGKKLFKDQAGIQGSLRELGNYDLIFTVTTEIKGEPKTLRLRGELEISSSDPIQAPEPCPITYANPKVKRNCESDAKLMTKINSIALAGTSEKGHGPVQFLLGALHAHATNTESIAWFWKGKTMHVVATGKKNNQNKQQQRGGRGPKLKTAQYDWDEG